jgi:hypothetical protein
MKDLPTDASIVTAGITAPIWLDALTQVQIHKMYNME